MSYTTVSNGQTLNVTGSYGYLQAFYYPYFQPYSYNDTVNFGGVENVAAFGQTYYATVNWGGVENVLSSGTANTTFVNYGGLINVGGDAAPGAPTATANQTILAFGGFQNVRSNGISVGAVVQGGVDSVFSGGTALGSIVVGASAQMKGYEVVNTGGVSSGATVGAYGVEEVGPGGVVNFATVGNAGLLDVFAGGVANGTTVQAGGEFDNYGTANATILSGLEQLYAGGRDNGVTLNAGGVENVYAGGGVNNAVLNGGSLDILAGGAATGVTQFVANADSHLLLGDSQHFNGQISGFNLGDRIDLQDIAYGADRFGFSGTATSGTLTISDGVHQAALSLLGDYRGVGVSDTGNGGEIFFATSDGHGGTLVGIGITGVTRTSPLGPDQPVMR